MDNRNKLTELKAEILKSIAHPTRLAIVEMLSDSEKCVCELNEQIDADHSTISKHLSLLKRNGILSCRKEGLKVFYRLEVPCILKFMDCITDVIRKRTDQHLEALK
ncbi:MAG: metalloregulator ArsR/SmtB family transcription factor [candidate division Zixibacteria bacterium]|nr:metalloregulator ArsR/SmtB family transcription factor [candidate division Zixibacteria bacterium]